MRLLAVASIFMLAILYALQFYSSYFSIKPVHAQGNLILIKTILPEPMQWINQLPWAGKRQGDAESLIYVPDTNSFWIADDDVSSIFEIDLETGHFISRIPASDLLVAFPDAANCSYKGSLGEHPCSYIEELENIAYDSVTKSLYLFNTISHPQRVPQRDKPAVFRLRLDPSTGKFKYDSWRKFPEDYSPEACVVIEGKLYVGLGHDVVLYDYESNKFLDIDRAAGPPVPLLSSVDGLISAMTFDGKSLWVVTETNHLARFNWSTQSHISSFDLSAFGIIRPKGIQYIDDKLLVLDGEFPNPIYVFTVPGGGPASPPSGMQLAEDKG